MITQQAQLAFNVIQNILTNETEDSLNEIVENLETLLYKAKQIVNVSASIQDGSDYDLSNSCEIFHKN